LTVSAKNMRNLKRNRFSFLLRGIWLASCQTIGGQAVMEGVMMRNSDVYGLAVRGPDGEIHSESRPWRSLTRRAWSRCPFVRGFPILLETMINGIKALNRSVEMSGGEEVPSSGWQMGLGLALALAVALGLFVVAPHLLSLAMLGLGYGGDVEGLAFHLWDGFYKCAIFMGYIWLISFIPDIRRVFEYHGAEHKTIHAYERSENPDVDEAARMSRLHPRCGTTFLLFVICLSIVLQALLVPGLLLLWTPESAVAKHVLTIMFKLLLVIPISALAYELIRNAAKLPPGIAASIVQAPGLTLQRLTTREPGRDQLEVALAALSAATESEGRG